MLCDYQVTVPGTFYVLYGTMVLPVRASGICTRCVRGVQPERALHADFSAGKNLCSFFNSTT
jgi:hypothetical protein